MASDLSTGSPGTLNDKLFLVILLCLNKLFENTSLNKDFFLVRPV